MSTIKKKLVLAIASGAIILAALGCERLLAQDASTGAVLGTLVDASGARIPYTAVTIVNAATGLTRTGTTDGEGRFAALALPPGQYLAGSVSPGLTPALRSGITVEVGAAVEIELKLDVEGKTEIVTVSADAPQSSPQTSEVSSVVDERAISNLPLNGRRFTDLALLTPGVTQDPRGLTSSSNGDLAFGGIRGFQTSYLVDGGDDNNAFFAQATGRYRAPYQFSNEVIQEFRVSSHSYGADSGRSGGALINVVTRSGSNQWHGDGFYYLRDSALAATPATVNFKPSNRQHQFGGVLGGPIRKNRVFFLAGYDQHIFNVPTVVQFLNGSSVLTPVASQPAIPGDYEDSDKTLVLATASQLDSLAGTSRSQLLGNTGFIKFDVGLSPKQQLSFRLNVSRYHGANNVFFDPASPVSFSAIDTNGTENVSTESAAISLTSGLRPRLISHFQIQFLRDLQQSFANSSQVNQRLDTILQGIGRSNILPRQTREHKLQLAETLSYARGRHQVRFGGDTLLTSVYNYFPSLSGGQYIFNNIKVNPFTFLPQDGGLELTPLRAYSHQVAKYYDQNFGLATTHPDSSDYSAFVQDSVQVTRRLNLSFGLRYDRQVFSNNGLASNPLYPDSGKLPSPGANFAPRVGFAYDMGRQHPIVWRGGYGSFYTRIPQIYASEVQLNNGLNQFHLQLNNSKYFDHLAFPQFPLPLASCSSTCAVPDSLRANLTTEISAFPADFRTPRVQQASLSAERDLGHRFSLTASYLFVGGQKLIRARDKNLPVPVNVSYPVYDDAGVNLLGYYDVASFSTQRYTQSLDCPFPPCINPLVRPIPQIGAINVFESAARSSYHGGTLELQRRVSKGTYIRLAYTYSHAIDNTQDALVAGRPVTVQNSYNLAQERSNSVTDQRHRLVAAWIAEPHWGRHEHDVLGKFANRWKLTNIFTYGSGRPTQLSVTGDPNQDGNSGNDRLPGLSRNSFSGPVYSTFDFRAGRSFTLSEKFKLEMIAESFNLLNRNNRTFTITQDNLTGSGVRFLPLTATVQNQVYPGQYRVSSTYRSPTSSFAPREVQLAVKLVF